MSQPEPAVEAAESDSAVPGLPVTRLSQVFDGIISAVGSAASWLWPLLIGIIVLQVVLRYVFGKGYIFFEELQWHIYGASFMIGLSYAVMRDRHVRIDVLAENWPPRVRAWIEMIGLSLFLLPVVSVILVEGFWFVHASYEMNEISGSPGGLPYRWAIKSFMLVGAVLLILAGLSRLSRVTAFLFGVPRALHQHRS